MKCKTSISSTPEYDTLVQNNTVFITVRNKNDFALRRVLCQKCNGLPMFSNYPDDIAFQGEIR